ncbi:tetratricopeptide repeat protein 33 isoform X2 [Silurus meridionalis]|nr:tetratricopeptide repeat protein 33 isoform X2 [Silurus meridionalis]XP_046694874.1 tetratricopeptide repeat protein 33 isoform X2 [Silurus meridionalis]KAI5089381.1 tetratricopeptide repeat protein 33 [Silurus meridionalis]
MTSFSWNRKIGEKVSKAAVQQFESQSVKVEDHVELEEVDWLHAIKRRREILLDDCTTKSKRLKDEGEQLAEQSRHWEAVRKWDEAIQLTPEEAVLYEMKSQVLTILQEVFPAVQSAEMAVKLRPTWWEAWQTLGRAQLNLGEIELAIRSFQVALHLHPIERMLWEEDLRWALHLREEKRAVQQETAQHLSEEIPELQQDYEDFESDEVIAACTAIAERQKRGEEFKKNVIVDVKSVANESEVRKSDSNALVKAKII